MGSESAGARARGLHGGAAAGAPRAGRRAGRGAAGPGAFVPVRGAAAAGHRARSGRGGLGARADNLGPAECPPAKCARLAAPLGGARGGDCARLCGRQSTALRLLLVGGGLRGPGGRRPGAHVPERCKILPGEYFPGASNHTRGCVFSRPGGGVRRAETTVCYAVNVILRGLHAHSGESPPLPAPSSHVVSPHSEVEVS